MKKDDRSKVKPCNICKCQSCEGMPEFEHKEMLEHLKVVHGLPENTQYVRSMMMHADARDWYSYDWQWEEKKPGGVRFQQHVVELRDAESRAYWE